MKTTEKLAKIEEYLKDKKCILAFSAGSDSTLLAYALSQVSPDSLLATIDNGMMSEEFIEYTKESAKKFNLKHEVIKLKFLEDERIIKNDNSRCYICRQEMYTNIEKLPQFNDYDYFLEGTNITDLLEYRPGIIARDEHKMISPLVECGINKDDVYELLNYLNLDYSKNTTCHATRIKNNQTVTKEKLNKVIESEKIVRNYINQDNIRVRLDENTAIITVDNPLELLKTNIEEIRDKISELGFEKIFIDITGYEKTEFKYEKSLDETVYYNLPYTINLKKTYDKLKENRKENLKLDEKSINYSNIIIEKNGKISSSNEDNFTEQLFEILPYLEHEI